MQKVKYSQNIMVWSVVSVKDPGRFYIVQNTMRQDEYLDVLKNREIPQLHQLYPGGSFVFMMDSAPCQTVKSVKRFLSESGLEVFPCSGNSPITR